MPIQFPQPKRGNPFDRWVWQWGAVRPAIASSLARVTDKRLGDGSARPRVPVNLSNLGTMYQHGENSGSRLNPAAGLMVASRIEDSERRVFSRVGGTLRQTLSGITKDAAGAVLGNCRVMIFRSSPVEFVVEGVSDGAGLYVVDVLAAGPFFGVFYKTGAPDVAGTTRNDLVPAIV